MARRVEPITKRTAKNGTVSYTFQMDVGTKPDGTRDRRRFTYPKYDEARREYRRISAEVAAGTYVAQHKTTVGDYLTSWLDGRRDIRTVTLEGYRAALKPVIERIGGLGLQQLTRQHVEELVEWRMGQGRAPRRDLSQRAEQTLTYIAAHDNGATYADIEKNCGTTGVRTLDRLLAGGYVERPSRGRYVAVKAAQAPTPTGGVSPRTVVTMLVQLTAALDDAVAEGLIVRNVARLVERPKVIPTEMKAWTPAQADQFRRHVADRRDYPLWLLTLAGLRRSEVLGLTWAAVDLDAGTLDIRQGRVPVAGGTETGDPKSWRSRRTLPLPDDVVTALKAFKATQAKERLLIGADWPDTGLIAVNGDGTPIRPETYSGEFQRLAQSAELPRIRLHDVRHTAASILHDMGLPVVVIAAWLGHDPAMSARVYGHAYEDQLVNVGAALFRPAGS